MIPILKEIWLANLGDYRPDNSSIQKGIRPVVILKSYGNDNNYFCNVVVTTTKPKKSLPTHYVIENYREIGLMERSTVLAEQFFSISNEYMIRRICTMDDLGFENVLECVCVSFGIPYLKPSERPNHLA